MRTTFLSQGRQTLANLQLVQARKARATEQVSSGLRVTKPSDSPNDAVGIVRTRTDLRVIEQFKLNLEGIQAELKAVDGALSQAGDVLNRAAVLAAQAASDAQESAEGSRDVISGEIEAIFRHLVSIANSTYSGKFVFGGSTDDIAPFVIDASSPDGVVYQGDSGSREIIFPDGRPAQVSLPGNSVFAQPEFFLGSGRTPYTAGSALPNPPVGIGVAFSGDVDAVLSVDVPGFSLRRLLPAFPREEKRSASPSPATTDRSAATSRQRLCPLEPTRFKSPRLSIPPSRPTPNSAALPSARPMGLEPGRSSWSRATPWESGFRSLRRQPGG